MNQPINQENLYSPEEQVHEWELAYRIMLDIAQKCHEQNEALEAEIVRLQAELKIERSRREVKS